jgi:diadenosine tetraphosphate (Ap4A) HIT family hydrolase
VTATLEEFRDKVQLGKLTVAKLEHWTWSVRPTHATLGAGVISLNRFCTQFGDMTRDEAAELSDLMHKVEKTLKAAFQPDKFNYLMLMMIDAHLHFHVLPRYQSPRSFAEIEWIDPAPWPAIPTMKDGGEFQNSPILLDIRNFLIKIAEE